MRNNKNKQHLFWQPCGVDKKDKIHEQAIPECFWNQTLEGFEDVPDGSRVDAFGKLIWAIVPTPVVSTQPETPLNHPNSPPADQDQEEKRAPPMRSTHKPSLMIPWESDEDDEEDEEDEEEPPISEEEESEEEDKEEGVFGDFKWDKEEVEEEEEEESEDEEESRLAEEDDEEEEEEEWEEGWDEEPEKEVVW